MLGALLCNVLVVVVMVLVFLGECDSPPGDRQSGPPGLGVSELTLLEILVDLSLLLLITAAAIVAHVL